MFGVNPLLWLHFHLGGAWRSNATIVGVFIGLVALGAGISYRLADPGGAGSVSGVWLGIMTAAQGAFLVLLVPSAIRRAVQRDFQTGMIESHRLAPLSGLKIVVGYLTGPSLQAGLLYTAALLMGSLFAGHYGFTVGVPQAVLGWYFLQACLLLLAFMLSSLALLSALASSGKTGMLGVIVLSGVFGAWMVVAAVPGLALVTGVLTGSVLFSAITRPAGGPIGDPTVVAVTAVVQLLLGVTFARAACRKVRAPERAMFSVSLALVLATVWAATLIIGISLATAAPWLLREFHIDGHTQIVASTVAFLAVAQFTLIASAVDSVRLDRIAAFGDMGARRQRGVLLMVPLLLGLMAAGAMLLMYRVLPAGLSNPTLDEAFADWPLRVATLVSLVLCFWTDFQWLYAVTARGKGVLAVVITSAIVLKGAPLLLDGIWMQVALESGQHVRLTDGYLSGFSPIGTVILSGLGAQNIWIGLAGQALIAVLVTAWASKVRRWATQSPAEARPVTVSAAKA